MRRYTYETDTSVPAEKLFRAKADIRRWPEWDDELESTGFDVPLEPGARFVLKPKGGPSVPMRIEAVEAPRLFIDIALMPLARMRTASEFVPAGGGTRVRISIEVFGPLAFLWDRLVARKLAADCEQQTRRFIAFAEQRP
jgi:uncharacterized protein YndB with AHSA1/START domain